FTAVMQGRADAFVSDTTYVSLIARENPGKLSVLLTHVTAEKFSVAVRPQDKELLETFNKFIKNWKSSTAYSAAYDKYFRS
ncbi:MAG: transporter substrate-binding domain-containing protein, partial [Bdellovibrionota bacterium]